MGEAIVCVRETDGFLCKLNISEANALARAADLKTFVEHAAALCEDDISQFIGQVARLAHVKPPIAARVRSLLGKWRKQGVVSGYGGLYKKYAADLSALREKGLLLSDLDLLSALADEQADDDCEHLGISSLCIPTATRRHKLAGCLHSFLLNFEKYGRTEVRVCVMQDSEAPEYGQVIAQTRANFPSVRVEHCDLAHRRHLIDGLARQTSVPREIIEFGLMPPPLLNTGMTSRNAFMLMSPGECVLFADDDTVCLYRNFQRNSGCVTVSAAVEPCEAWFYQDSNGLRLGSPVDWQGSILATHEALLGRSTTYIVRNATEVRFRDITVNLVRAILRGCGRIGITSTGCCGDSGLYGSGSFLLFAGDETFARICRSRESYETAVLAGKIARAPISTTLSRGSYFQSMSYAMDNRLLTPPFFPMGRNADTAYLLLHLLLDRQLWVAHLPLAISHESDTGRQPYFVKHIEQFSRQRLGDLLMYALQSVAPFFPMERGKAMGNIGQQLISLGRVPAKSFMAFARESFLRRQEATLRRLEERLSNCRVKLATWEKDSGLMLTDIKRSMSEPNCCVPVDLEAEVGSGALEVAQTSIRDYGRLLCAWEELVNQSRKVYEGNPQNDCFASVGTGEGGPSFLH